MVLNSPFLKGTQSLSWWELDKQIDKNNIPYFPEINWIRNGTDHINQIRELARCDQSTSNIIVNSYHQGAQEHVGVPRGSGATQGTHTHCSLVMCCSHRSCKGAHCVQEIEPYEWPRLCMSLTVTLLNKADITVTLCAGCVCSLQWEGLFPPDCRWFSEIGLHRMWSR